MEADLKEHCAEVDSHLISRDARPEARPLHSSRFWYVARGTSSTIAVPRSRSPSPGRAPGIRIAGSRHCHTGSSCAARPQDPTCRYCSAIVAA